MTWAEGVRGAYSYIYTMHRQSGCGYYGAKQAVADTLVQMLSRHIGCKIKCKACCQVGCVASGCAPQRSSSSLCWLPLSAVLQGCPCQGCPVQPQPSSVSPWRMLCWPWTAPPQELLVTPPALPAREMHTLLLRSLWEMQTLDSPPALCCHFAGSSHAIQALRFKSAG